jgi:transcriptional regulator with XRE-family HTH domain
LALKKGTKLITAADRKALKKLGERINELRTKKKLTIYEVTGDDLPIKSRQHWQKIEAGQLSLTFVTFLKIAETLKVDPQDLL